MTIFSKHARRLGEVLVVLGLLAGVLATTVWYNMYRTKTPDEATKQTLREHFLYGSIGTEGLEGTPYWIWKVLPKVFPEYLPGPGGYASLGMSYEPGHELPTGVTKKFIGFDRVGLNCAMCHVSQVRLSADQPLATLYVAGPSHQFRAQDYQQFLFRCAADPRFNADVLMAAIASEFTLSAREAALYRYALIGATKKALLQQRTEFAWQFAAPRSAHGPGRVDPFNPMRFREFHEPDDHSVGTADIPAIWNQRAKTKGYLHWDGLSKDLFEVALSSAIGDGARDKYLDEASLHKVQSFLMSLAPPPYPLPIDQVRAARGATLYAEHCAGCHAEGGRQTGGIVPLTEIGTDPSRANQWTPSQVQHWKELAAKYRASYGATWDFATFDKPGGYVSMLLDGIWLRGPYLHNGSVPTLRALLDAPAERPATFYRGYELFDGERVGFVSDVAEVKGRKFFLYDTKRVGNGNGGHVYATGLPPEHKDAIVEYMKTL